MSLDIPNSADVPQTAAYGNGAMAKPMRSDTKIEMASLRGDTVQKGACAVSPGTNAYTVKVAAGTWFADGVQADVAAQDNVALPTADATFPMWCLLELDTSQVLQKNTGTPAANPVTPTPTTGRVVVAAVFIPANATAVDAALSTANGNAKIIDKRADRAMIERRYYTPTYSSPSDLVTNTTATTVAVASNGVNLNTFVGAQTLNVASTAGLLGDGTHGGAVVLTHGAVDTVITYTAVASGTTLTGCTAVGAPSVVIATGDVVTRAKILTSATTTTFQAGHVNSFVRGNANIPQYVIAATAPAAIVSVGTVPNQSGMTYAQISQPVTGSATAQTASIAIVTFTWTRPTNSRIYYARVAQPGQGGAGGRCGAAGGIRGGGGGGGSGASRSRWLDSGSVGATETITVGQGAPPGQGGAAGGANGQSGGAGLLGAAFGAHVAMAPAAGSFLAAGGGTASPGGGGGTAVLLDGDTQTWNAGLTNMGSPIGGTTSSTAQAGGGAALANCGGAGGGGGALDAGNTRRQGGVGGTGDPQAGANQPAGGTAGTNVDGGTGGNAAATTVPEQQGAGGGGGTASTSSATSGGNGGNGASPSGGGGGGGAGTTGGVGTGGSGGFPGDAAVLVIAYP